MLYTLQHVETVEKSKIDIGTNQQLGGSWVSEERGE